MVTKLRFTALAILSVCLTLNGWGQTSYLGLDGGFEGSATIDNATTYAAPQTGKWAKANATQTIANETATFRSGANALKINNSSTTGRRVWSPNIAVSSTTSQVTVQFYIRAASTTNGQEVQPGIINNNEGIPGSYSTISTPNTWTKITYSKASSTWTTISGLFLHRQLATGGGDMFVDDMCVYTGAVDNAAPNSAGTVTVNNPTSSSLDISWAAASGGVDGGGYMVVRYSSNPNADNDPLVNGIYATGNTYTLGTGSLTGTVRYVGTGTSFTDNVGLAAGTTYYYKVYTFDKAYNYATESSGNGATSTAGSPPTITSSLTASGTYGTTFSTYTITASNSPTSYNATGLPTGLSVNTTNGQITGTPTQTGTFNVDISAGNTNGTDTKTLVITIGQKALTVTGISIANKQYDRTNAATISGTPSPSGVYGSDNVTITGSPVATFNAINVANGIAVTLTGNYTLGGTDAAKYTLTQPSGFTANITAKPLTITGATAQDKVYNGNTTATITGATLVGVIPGDAVTVSGGGTFASANAGNNIAVTAALTLGGAQAGNYSLTQPTGLTANITPASQTITFNALPAKTTADADFAPGATATSGLTVTYTSSNTAVATIVSGNIHIVGAGTTTITASQAGNTNYSAATSVDQTLTVTLAAAVLYQHNFGTTTISSHPYTVSPTATPVAGVLNSNLSNSSWSNAASAWTSFAGNVGQAIASSSISGSNPWTLTFDVASGYSIDITSFNFWRQSSQSTNTWTMTVNGTTVGSGSIPTSGTAIGNTSVSNAVNGLTGTVTVVLTFGGSLTGSIRVDDFTLSGYVNTVACAAPTSNATNVTNTTSSATTSAGLSWTGAVLADGYVVAVRTTNNDFSGLTFADGTSLPTAGAAPWTDNEVAAVVTGTTATISNLSPSTTYYFKVYSYRDCFGTYKFNNSNATGNPFTTTTATPAPEITVVRTSNSSNVADGSSFDFGSVNVGSTLDVQFTITNDAAATANLTLPASLTAGGAFSISSQPGTTSLAPGASANFTVRFTPVSGANSHSFAFTNNDGNENPYNITFTGTGIPACVTPNPVTNITLTPAAGAISGVIDVPAGGADGYLIVRNATATLSGTPSGTYSAGDAFGTGTVVQFGSSTSFNATSLGANATFYFFVYSYRNTGCFGGPVYATGYNESATTLNFNYQSFDNFNRTGAGVGIPSSGGTATWTENEGGTSCSPASEIIRTANNQLEISNCNQGSTASCGTSNNKQISFDMTGKYATQFNTSSQVMEWYVNLSHTRSSLSGFGSGNYGVAYILGSSEEDFNSTTAQGYALLAGESGTPDNLRLVSFNGQPSNWSAVINSGVDFTQNKRLSVKVTYDPSTNLWSLWVRDDGASFADPTTISGTAVTATNSAYTNLNLKYAGAFWNHGASCEEILKIDNMFIPSPNLSPEIKVEYTTNNAVEISDAGSYSFGPVNVASGNYTATYTVTNTGTANLTLGAITIGGAHASNFTYTAPVSTTLAPNATTTFTITFDPSATGNRTATFSMVTNDIDENPFNFTLTGEGTATMPVINEFVTDINGSDTYEYVEVYGETSKNYSNLWVLGIEGDNVNPGRIENVYQVGTTSAGGYWMNTVSGTDQIENGTITYILVEGFTGALNDNIDANGDGVIDNKPWNRILDDVAYRDAAGAKVYSSVFFTSTFAGYSPPQNVGGASRIPNGFDSNSTGDWMRNEHTGFGIAGFNTATPTSTEAINTPGAANQRYNVWTGTISTDWSVAGNWINNVVPSSTVDAVIPNVANDPVFPTGNYHAVARYFVMENNSVLDMTNGDLTVHANALTANNVTINNGVVVMTGTTASTFTANNITLKTLAASNTGGVTLLGTVALTSALELRSGNLTNSGSLTLKSTSTSHAIFNDFGAPVGTYTGTYTGTINEERYYRATSANSYNQHYMGSPVANATLAQFGAGGTSGAVTPTADCSETQLDQTSVYGSVFSYNEADGATCPMKSWNVKAGSMAATPAQGFSVAKTGAGTLTVSGTPNTATSYAVSGLTNSNWTKGTLQHPSNTAFGSGWHMVSNPYNATLDLTSITPPAGFDNQIQIWDVIQGQYYTLTGTKLIAPFQAFFVHKTSPGGSATYTIDGNWRVATPATFYAQSIPEQLTITATNTSNQLYDVTTVGFNANATDQFDAPFDANKLTGSIGRHNLSTQNNGYELNTNILTSIQTTSTVNMTFEPGQAGTYTLTFDGLNSFDPTSYIMLEDKQLNTMHDVRSGDYTFTATAQDNWNRFVLHFTPKAEIATVDQQCETPGAINITQPGSASWTYTITDNNNTTISSGTLNEATPVTTNVTSGTYTLTLTDANNYEVVKNITVGGTTPIVAAFTPSANTTTTNTDVAFNSTTTASDYYWDFGDGTTATGQNVIHSYGDTGTYTVSLIVISANGCSNTTTQTVTVNAEVQTGIGNINPNQSINIWSNGNTVYVDFSRLTKTDATIEIYNVLGQQLVNEKFGRSSIFNKAIGNVEAAYVIVKVKQGETITTKKVLIGNTR
jgi:hypothetical protein